MNRRPSVKNGRCAKCGSDNLMSWTNDHTVICDDCGCNHAWPRNGAFYRGKPVNLIGADTIAGQIERGLRWPGVSR
jgi:hypothetical protein